MSSFLHVIRMPMLTVSFLSQLYSGILYLENVFLCPKIQMDLSLEIADNFYLQVLSKRLSCILFIFLLLFPVTLWLVVTVQPCMEKTSIKNMQRYLNKNRQLAHTAFNWSDINHAISLFFLHHVSQKNIAP